MNAKGGINMVDKVFNRNLFFYAIILFVISFQNAYASKWVKTISGEGREVDGSRYGGALISNGSISTIIDYLGEQNRRPYAQVVPYVVRAGRRYGMPNDTLVPMGYFNSSVRINGKEQAPLKWTHSLDVKSAVSENVVEYPDAVVKTVAFVPLDREFLVVRKIVEPKSEAKVDFEFVYTFAPETYKKDRERVRTEEAEKGDSSAILRYVIFGLDTLRGELSILSSAPAKVSFRPASDEVLLNTESTGVFDSKKMPIKKRTRTFPSDCAVFESCSTASKERPFVCDYFITFADDMDFYGDELVSGENSASGLGEKWRALGESMRADARKLGFDGLLASHKKAWGEFWRGAEIDIPDKSIENAYYTGLYHQRCNTTKWSYPVGIFSGSHWGGAFFGWDEAFCAMALSSSGKFAESRRSSDFRKSILWTAMNRTARNRPVPKSTGAQFTWITYEPRFAAIERAFPGYWLEHIFHMSNISAAAWTHYKYTGDLEFLKNVAYPLLSESAAYYYSHWIYDKGDGSMFVSRCTDLERLGPAKLNPFMTSCGIIYTFERAAESAEMLGIDAEHAAKWRSAAAALRKGLPRDSEKYLPYEDCAEKSINVIGGLFPYPIFDEREAFEKRAVYDFFENINDVGNMYAVGSGVSAWYAAWTTEALVWYFDKTAPQKLLSAAAKTSLAFGDLCEINEPKVQSLPWFSTASGNFVSAVNKMLLHNLDNGEIRVAPSVPESWKDYSFKLPCYGGAWIDFKVAGGKIAKMKFLPPEGGNLPQGERTIVLPASIVDESSILVPFERDERGIVIKADLSKGDIYIAGENA